MHCHLSVAWMFDRVRRKSRLSDDSDRRSLDLAFAALVLGDLDRPANPAPMLGIAQHYGIATEYLDLTYLDPAAVFATQRWLPLREAVKLLPGSSAPAPDDTNVGVLYRYDTRRLLAHGVTVGDLSSGNGGSRPILQEARLIGLRYGQDLELLEDGAYEVFPFGQSGPYTYGRPIRPSPLLNGDQRRVVELALSYLPAHPFGRSRSVSMRDLVLPSFYLSPDPYNPQAWQLYLGDRPDPFLALGLACEEERPSVEDLESLRDYAKLLFGDWFGKSLLGNRSVERSLKRSERPMPPSRREATAVRRSLRDETGVFRDADGAPAMVHIPAGSFRMGSPTASHPMYRDEMPERERTIDRPFAVGVYPVTFAEMAVFGRDSGSLSAIHVGFLIDQGRKHPLLPAVMTSWHDAAAYCQWLSDRSGREYRLLTETEWEYVCRAGTTTRYWWGDDFDPSRANTHHGEIDLFRIAPPSTFSEGTQYLHMLVPVDACAPNPWGLFDLHGNTWEWVEDIYRDPKIDPSKWVPRPGRTEGIFRSLRGGSWMDPPESLRSACRSWAPASARDRVIAFRVARS
jgi:formylglycine-generating enzyme required for sulfatase activity